MFSHAGGLVWAIIISEPSRQCCITKHCKQSCYLQHLHLGGLLLKGRATTWFADYDRPDKPASVRTGDEESSEQIVSPIPPPHLIISSMSLVMCERLTLPLFRHIWITRERGKLYEQVRSVRLLQQTFEIMKARIVMSKQRQGESFTHDQ
jgi:hypothetical protein